MHDLSTVEHLLKRTNPSQAAQELEQAVEEHFEEIVHCIDQEKTQEAAKLIEKVFAKGAPDVRLIFYYFYTNFAEEGIKSFGEIFPLMISMLKEHMEHLLPVNKRSKHVESSLNWFFSHLLFRFKYFEKMYASGKIHPIWEKSVSELDSEELEHLIASVLQFRDFFFDQWPKSSIKDKVTHLLKKVEELRSMVAVKNPSSETSDEEDLVPEAVTESAPQGEVLFKDTLEETTLNFSIDEGNNEGFKEAPVEEEDVLDDHLLSSNENQSNDLLLENAGVSVPSDKNSDPLIEPMIDTADLLKNLQEFLRKLRIFEILIRKNDYLKAAVVAKDIDHLIETFDPLNYFPKMFAHHFSLFAKHASALTEHYDYQESLQVKARELPNP